MLTSDTSPKPMTAHSPESPYQTLPGDPMGRFWVELAGCNPSLASEFRPVLVSVFTTDYMGKPGIAGTGFVLGVADCFIVIATAKHVLQQVKKLQNPYQQSNSLPFFENVARSFPKIESGKVKVLFMNDVLAGMLNVVHVCANETTDLAICLAEIPKLERSRIAFTTVPLEMSMPRIGEVVHIASLVHPQRGIDFRLVEDSDAKNDIEYEIERRVEIRRGSVVEVHPNGFRQYKWPCFTTTIPVPPGMSGGFAYIPKDGQKIAACGVVCADTSTETNVTKYETPGGSVVGCSYAALALRVPDFSQSDYQSSTVSIYDMMNRGLFPMPIDGLDHVVFIEKENGDAAVGLNPPI